MEVHNTSQAPHFLKWAISGLLVNEGGFKNMARFVRNKDRRKSPDQHIFGQVPTVGFAIRTSPLYLGIPENPLRRHYASHRSTVPGDHQENK